MKKILDGMIETMNSVGPPRMTALNELHEAETEGPFSILIGTILSARTKDENTTKVVKKLFSRYRTPKALANALSLFVLRCAIEFAYIVALVSANDTFVF